MQTENLNNNRPTMSETITNLQSIGQSLTEIIYASTVYKKEDGNMERPVIEYDGIKVTFIITANPRYDQFIIEDRNGNKVRVWEDRIDIQGFDYVKLINTFAINLNVIKIKLRKILFEASAKYQNVAKTFYTITSQEKADAICNLLKGRDYAVPEFKFPCLLCVDKNNKVFVADTTAIDTLVEAGFKRF